jgi:GT2 family glycosyltransferase
MRLINKIYLFFLYLLYLKHNYGELGKFTSKALKIFKIGGFKRLIAIHKNIYCGFYSLHYQTAESSLDLIDDDTLISIIIVNWNGLHHLPELIDSIKKQTISNFEVIFVDNNSSDGSVKYIKNNYPEATVVKLETNTGFAYANNVGLNIAKGSIIALLNNDTRVEKDWLEQLFLTMKNESNCVAVSPKIFFWSKFQQIKIASGAEVTFSLEKLLDSLDYKKYFIRSNSEEINKFIKIDSGNPLLIDIPYQNKPISFAFESNYQNTSIRISSVSGHVNHLIDKSSCIYYSFKNKDKLRSYWIINNAGSQELNDFQPADRGFGEINSRKFDKKMQLNLLCGCSALIRREALLGLPLFADDFFNYYEDTELSRRLRNVGKIVYQPASVLYHKHSATSKEKSCHWHYYVTRNSILYQYMYTDSAIKAKFLTNKIQALKKHKLFLVSNSPFESEDAKFAQRIPELIDDLKKVVSKIKSNQIYQNHIPRIGIFNAFWNTYGGGEAHALFFAEYLQQYAVVDILGVEPFSTNKLSKYFGVNLSNTRKRVIKYLSAQDTSHYDIFINTSYQSNVLSKANLSFYILSFPQKKSTKRFAKSYFFLPNSNYTAHWAHRYWGNFNYKRIYPAVKLDESKKLTKKRKLIISIGRWCIDGHNKNQYELARAFVKAKKTDPRLSEWEIVFAGSLNVNRPEDKAYYKKTAALIRGYGGKALTNISYDYLQKLYKEASIYWHATGLNKDQEKEPELFEHFGMTVVEAASNGCIPMVFNAAGPAEIVKFMKVGYLWNDLDGLINQLKKYLSDYEKDPVAQDKARKHMMDKVNKFSIERLKKEFELVLTKKMKNIKSFKLDSYDF